MISERSTHRVDHFNGGRHWGIRCNCVANCGHGSQFRSLLTALWSALWISGIYLQTSVFRGKLLSITFTVPLSQSFPLHPGGHWHPPVTWWQEAPCIHWHLSSHPTPNRPGSHAEHRRWRKMNMQKCPALLMMFCRVVSFIVAPHLSHSALQSSRRCSCTLQSVCHTGRRSHIHTAAGSLRQTDLLHILQHKGKKAEHYDENNRKTEEEWSVMCCSEGEQAGMASMGQRRVLQDPNMVPEQPRPSEEKKTIGKKQMSWGG